MGLCRKTGTRDFGYSGYKREIFVWTVTVQVESLLTKRDDGKTIQEWLANDAFFSRVYVL